MKVRELKGCFKIVLKLFYEKDKKSIRLMDNGSHADCLEQSNNT